MDTLLLNVQYHPIARISWQQAMKLLVEGTAELLERYEGVIRSVTQHFPAPAVVRLTRWKPWKRSIKFNRENVYARDRGLCQFCGVQVPRKELTYDHVIPRAQGGTTRWDNVVVCCLPCNQRKGNRTPEQAGMRLLTKPVRPAKLLEGTRAFLQYREGMPLQWKSWLYWNVELEA